MIKIGHLKISILNMGDEEVRNQTERQLKFGLKKKKVAGVLHHLLLVVYCLVR